MSTFHLFILYLNIIFEYIATRGICSYKEISTLDLIIKDQIEIRLLMPVFELSLVDTYDLYSLGQAVI